MSLQAKMLCSSIMTLCYVGMGGTLACHCVIPRDSRVGVRHLTAASTIPPALQDLWTNNSKWVSFDQYQRQMTVFVLRTSWL